MTRRIGPMKRLEIEKNRKKTPSKHPFFIFSVVAGLLPKAFTVTERGKVTVKGKGEMVTFWVDSKANRVPPSREEVSKFSFEIAQLLYNYYFRAGIL